MRRAKPLFSIPEEGLEKMVEDRLHQAMSVRSGESPIAYMSRFDKARTLRLADDTFTLGGSFTISRSGQLSGAGATTVLDASKAGLTTSDYILTITADDVVVENMRIIGATTTNGIHITGNGVTLRNVTIESCSKSVVLSGARDFAVTGCSIRSSLDRAIHVTGSSLHGRINNNEIDIPSASGPPSAILLDSGVTKVVITGNEIARTGVIEMTNTGGAQTFNAPGAHGNAAVGNSAAVTEHT
jgi:hypothetical protein